MQYIILDGKTPTHNFKDGEGALSWEDVKEFDNVAAIVPDGYEVLDFDTTDDAKIMMEIVNKFDLKCAVMKTTRGVHCWFKSRLEKPKCFIKQRLAIGIYCDRKVGGRNAYVKIKQDGKIREQLRDIPLDQLDTVPVWLSPISAPSSQFNFKSMGEGSGRNQELYNYILFLQSKGFSKEDIKETISIVNDFVFVDPLRESEIETICRDEAFRSEEEIAEQTKTPPMHIAIADSIIADHNLLSYNGVTYEYADGYYQPADYLKKYTRNRWYGCKSAQVREVIDYIRDMRAIRPEDIKINPYVINLQNTRLDVRTGEKLPFTPEAIEFNRVDVAYNPNARCDVLDQMIKRVFCDDEEVIALFEEMMGSILIKHSRYQKAFLFYGSGSNGKSTILNLIRTFLGKDNYCAIPLEKITDRFNTAELENKLANIGDDIDNKPIKDTGTLKKLFSGDAITVEHKGERPYTIEPYAKHIYSCNTIPRSFDKSDGFYRRWMVIPFKAQISIDSEGYDPLIEDKITTPEALSHLLNIALRGAQRLIKRGHYITPKSVENALEAYKVENSTTLSWIYDLDLQMDYFLENPTDKLYSDFCDWCKQSGIKNDAVVGRKTFYKEIKNHFDFEEERKQKRINGAHKWFFLIKID